MGRQYNVFIDSTKCIGCLQCIAACAHGKMVRSGSRPVTAPGSRCFGCMHCVSVCPSGAIGFEGIAQEALSGKSSQTEIESHVMSRRSVRSYKSELSPEFKTTVRRALEVSQWAPSARNEHGIKWIVIFGEGKIEILSDELIERCRQKGKVELVRGKLNGNNPATFNAPCLIAAAAPDDAYDPKIDSAIAMTTLELLLKEKNIGTCWLGYWQKMIEVCPEIEARFELPPGWHIRCAICAGFALNSEKNSSVWRPEPDILTIV